MKVHSTAEDEDGSPKRVVSTATSEFEGDEPVLPVLLAPQLESGFDEEAGDNIDLWLMRDREDEDDDSCSWLIVRESNRWRMLWNVQLAILLVYTATVMPYTLCFLDFRLTGSYTAPLGLEVVQAIVDTLFWIDLFINFAFTYTDGDGQEVRRLSKIVPHYLKGYFGLNLIACLPESFFTAVMPAMTSSGDGSMNRLTRLSRVQRIARLSRLLRLSRLAKLVPFMKSNPIWLWLQHLRGVRIINFFFGLMWTVHLVACGWYLCAALHLDTEITWVARRGLSGDASLLNSGPFDQWLTSMYWVLTVFSTVGFGDIYPITNGEIIYAGFTMLLGSVVHGIIVSEVINVITEMDDTAVEHGNQKQVVKAFADHTELSEAVARDIVSWIDPATKSRRVAHQYDRAAVKRMLTSGAMPYSMMEELPHNVYRGQLLKNQFMEICVKHAPQGRLPPRFPLFLAVAIIRHEYSRAEVVYQLHDHPFNIYLVVQGTFGSIAIPSAEGGCDVMISRALAPMHPSRTAVIGQTTQGDGSQRSFSRNSLFKRTAESPAKKIPKVPKIRNASKESVKPRMFFPYRLYSSGSYFGDYEIFMQALAVTKKEAYNQRNCTVRCESDTGSVLVLCRQELLALLKDFPHFGDAWYIAARNREQARLGALARHSRGMACRHLAAHTIQRLWRQWRHKGALGMPGMRTTSEAAPMDFMPFVNVKTSLLDEDADMAGGAKPNPLSGDAVSMLYSGEGEGGINNNNNLLMHMRQEMHCEISEVKQSVAELRSMMMAISKVVLGEASLPSGGSPPPAHSNPMREVVSSSDATGPPIEEWLNAELTSTIS